MEDDMAGRSENGLTLVCVAMAQYDCTSRYRVLPKAERLLRAVSKALSSNSTIIVNKPLSELPAELAQALPRGELAGRSLIVIWSGHGVTAGGGSLRLIVRNTVEPTINDTYQPSALAELAAYTGASQILFIIDTCQSAAGLMPTLQTVQEVTDAAMKSEDVWIGVLAASQSYGKARDGALLSHLRHILSKGPKTAEQRIVWSPYNRFIRGDEFLHTVTTEWPNNDPQQRIRPATSGQGRGLIPNPCWVENAPNTLVAHLVLSSRGADPKEEAWYFSGRRNFLEQIVQRVKDRVPGIIVITGPAGAGKSAILGRVGALSDRKERKAMRVHGALDDDSIDPGPGSVDANLNLRNMTSDDLIRQLGSQLRPGARNIWALMDWSAQQSQRGRTPVVLLDGLDESGAEARRVAEDVARLGQVCCVCVTTRSFESGAGAMTDSRPLPHLLAIPSSVILDLATEDLEVVRDDIRIYIRKRLAGSLADLPLDAMANAVTELALDDMQGGSFLLARVLTSQIRENPGIDPKELAHSLEQAFEEDIKRWPQIERDGCIVEDGARDLLFALAFAAGDGFPARDVWPVVATALNEQRTEFDEIDVYNLIGRYGKYYGRYIVAASEDGQAVYRLYHRRLVDHLRGAIEIEDDRAVTVYRAMQELAARQIGVGR
jgi:hypothetical protein